MIVGAAGAETESSQRDLEREGFPVTVANGLEEAEDALRFLNGMVRLVIVEGSPSGASARELMKSLRRVNPEIAILSFTDSSTPLHKSDRAVGLSRVAPKPHTRQELTEIVRDALGQTKI